MAKGLKGKAICSVGLMPTKSDIEKTSDYGGPRTSRN